MESEFGTIVVAWPFLSFAVYCWRHHCLLGRYVSWQTLDCYDIVSCFLYSLYISLFVFISLID